MLLAKGTFNFTIYDRTFGKSKMADVDMFADLPGLCVFFQQIMHYFLANYAPKILNYARIMRIAQYF